MEIEKITKFNEWWTTKKVKPSLLKLTKRPLFFDIKNYMKERQILSITGLRRVGKTTLLHQLIQDLLEEKVKPEKIIYFSFDEELEDFDRLIKAYEEKILLKKIEEEKIYIFLDEIQKLKNWQNKIKIYYDLYPNLKFIISGSAFVQINKKAKESLAGRIFDFLLEPLTFKEFLEWRNVKIDLKKIELYIREIIPLFYDYLRKGGFPELINEEDSEKIKKYIKNSIIERIIYKDLPEEFGIKDYELLKTLIETVAKQPGMSLNYDALSRNLHKNKKTIINYVFYLEYSLLIKVISNYRRGFLVSSRKLRKIYIANTALSFTLVEEFYSNSFLEKIAENFAVIETKTKHYYKNKYEVDIVIKKGETIIPIEVKYGKAESGSLFKFLNEFNIPKGIILTKELFDKKLLKDKEIRFIPLWAFSLLKSSLI